MTPPVPYTDEDLDVLARTLFGEARGDGLGGLTAVAWVIVNRVRRQSWYGRTVRDVCRKPLQFSCWNSTDPNEPLLRAATTAQPDFLRCVGVAALVLSGAYPDPTGGATNYHTIAAPKGTVRWPPKWAAGLVETIRIGNHVFYREAGVRESRAEE